MSTRRERKIRQLSGTVRVTENVQIEKADGGAFTVRAQGRAYPYEELGSAWMDSDSGVGDFARLAFVQNRNTLPIFFSRNSIPNAARLFDDEPVSYPDYYAPWRRLAISAAHRWHGGDWDDVLLPNSSILFVSDARISGGGALGGILRTDSTGRLWYTKGAELWNKALSTGVTSSENLVGTVQALSLCPLTERPYAWAGNFNPGESSEPAYEQGWTAGLDAFNGPGHGDNLEYQGSSDCLESNPYLANDLAPYFWQVEVPPPEEPPVDPDDWGDYQQGWMDAIEAEVRTRYNAGWSNAGCEVPEE